MFFCDKCGNIYNISREANVQKDNKDRVSVLMTKFKENSQKTPITEKDIEGVTLKTLQSNDVYDKMNEKDRKKLLGIIKGIDKDFNNRGKDIKATNAAFLVCKYCKNSEKIKPNTIIYSKKYTADMSSDVINYELLVNDYSLSRTAVYVCNNPKCETHKNPDLKEAVMTKNASDRIVYVCVVCKTHWINY